MKNVLLTSLCILFTLVLPAQEKPEAKELPKGELFTSTQSVRINGVNINLNAETGTVQSISPVVRC